MSIKKRTFVLYIIIDALKPIVAETYENITNRDNMTRLPPPIAHDHRHPQIRENGCIPIAHCSLIIILRWRDLMF